MDKKILITWINNVINFEDLSDAGEKTLVDVIKEIKKHNCQEEVNKCTGQ